MAGDQKAVDQKAVDQKAVDQSVAVCECDDTVFCVDANNYHMRIMPGKHVVLEAKGGCSGATFELPKACESAAEIVVQTTPSEEDGSVCYEITNKSNEPVEMLVTIRSKGSTGVSQAAAETLLGLCAVLAVVAFVAFVAFAAACCVLGFHNGGVDWHTLIIASVLLLFFVGLCVGMGIYVAHKR